MKTTKRIRFIVQVAVIAAIYVTLTMLSGALGLSSGIIQIRISEALCILPIFTCAAVPGLFLGCLISNTLLGSIVVDIIFGSLATLLGAVFTRIFRQNFVAAALSPVVSNSLIIPFVLKYAYGFSGSVFFFMSTVAAGEVLSCCVLGYVLYKAFGRHSDIFKNC